MVSESAVLDPKPRSREAPPRASAMVEALRGLGYSPGTALADVIDNIIAAGATDVDVTFTWRDRDSYLTVADNGAGMTDAELERAMRLGARSPLEAREAHDLGRFGLGLKTASFSQCRRLTVASRKAAVTSCLRWDLDVLAASTDGRWLLLEGAHPGSEHRLNELEACTSGTVVLWEMMDRICLLYTSPSPRDS